MPVERFTISLDEDLTAAMDEVRGLVTRSRWIAEAVKLGLAVAEQPEDVAHYTRVQRAIKATHDA